ncbi:hypothetical protein BC937DRAFT_95115 [Endogone sp. FLAS-F59071]|nr:hypothetical protein BC937DRAFT_95115 [Endogone sp. FLAS-F59071]|eukprot:RUS20480.1 hypothetical protein BC937DRAFT_95115 [Endogone sp. FLAS-F59071]
MKFRICTVTLPEENPKQGYWLLISDKWRETFKYTRAHLIGSATRRKSSKRMSPKPLKRHTDNILIPEGTVDHPEREISSAISSTNRRMVGFSSQSSLSITYNTYN